VQRWNVAHKELEKIKFEGAGLCLQVEDLLELDADRLERAVARRGRDGAKVALKSTNTHFGLLDRSKIG